MSGPLKNPRLINPSLAGKISIDGVDVTDRLASLLQHADASKSASPPCHADDARMRILNAEVGALKMLCKQLSDKIDRLSAGT
jgi:hypothetical protein